MGIVSSSLSGLNAHWSAATLAEEFGRLRAAVDAQLGPAPTARPATAAASPGVISPSGM